MRAWVAFMRERAGEDLVCTGDFHFGDWLAYATTDPGYPGATTGTDGIATAFFAHSIGLGAGRRMVHPARRHSTQRDSDGSDPGYRGAPRHRRWSASGPGRRRDERRRGRRRRRRRDRLGGVYVRGGSAVARAGRYLLGVARAGCPDSPVLGARPSIRVGRVASAVGPAARRATEAMPQRIVEEAQRGRWPHAAATRRARGGCGRRPRRTSSPMRTGIDSSALLVCSSQDPRARPTGILGRAPRAHTRRGLRRCTLASPS